MKTSLSPKEMARAIGVSESSLKRWVDDGRIPALRTAGGHRRIPVADAVRFIRESAVPVAQPDALGLSELVGPASTEDLGERLADYLVRGEASQAQSLVVSLYMSGTSPATICDGPLRGALRRVGELWLQDQAGIFVEHRASEICQLLLRSLQSLVEPPSDAPTAVGGGISNDSGALATLAAAVVVAAEGVRAINLGPNTPAQALLVAAQQHGARFVWLSLTHPQPVTQINTEIQQLFGGLEPRGVPLMVGAADADRLPRRLPPGVMVGHSMAELAAFIRGLSAGSR